MINMTKVGRNAPCPCGSGLKYKKCCLPREEASRTAPSGTQTNMEHSMLPNENENLYVTIPETLEEMNAAIARIPWSNLQYGDIARELVPHLADRFSWDEINATTLIWFAYSRELQPAIQKSGVILAALEYSLCLLTDRQGVTKAEVAKRYEVSASSVSKRISELSPYVERAMAVLNSDQ